MKQTLVAILIGVVTLGACGDDAVQERRYTRRQAEEIYREAQADRIEAEARRRAAEEEMAQAQKRQQAAEAEHQELARQLGELNGVIDALNEEAVEIDLALAAARTKADRDRVAAAQEELRRKQKVAQERINKVRAGVKLKCPPDQPLC